MSRKSIIISIAVGVLAAATLVSAPASAHLPGGGHPGHPGGHHGGGHWGHWGHYRHYVHFHDRVYVRPVTYAVRGPCTCLTKNYTPEGQVVFQDLCTKEMASASADGSSDQTQNEQGPANMAGQTYQDYLKANPQSAQAGQAQKN